MRSKRLCDLQRLGQSDVGFSKTFRIQLWNFEILVLTKISVTGILTHSCIFFPLCACVRVCLCARVFVCVSKMRADVSKLEHPQLIASQHLSSLETTRPSRTPPRCVHSVLGQTDAMEMGWNQSGGRGEQPQISWQQQGGALRTRSGMHTRPSSLHRDQDWVWSPTSVRQIMPGQAAQRDKGFLNATHS